jgi:hypothetical protein
MNGGYTFESEPFEADFETDEREYPYEREGEDTYEEEEEEGEYIQEEEEGEAPQAVRKVVKRVPVIRVLYRLHRAGRLGWKAGRLLDKVTGMVFGKTISKAGADLLFKVFGRSTRLEDAFNSLPEPLRRRLNQLAD